MEKAAISGTYADFKLVKTRSVVQMVIEIPIEEAQKVTDAFGLPNPAKEINVAVARLNEEYVSNAVKSYAGQAKLLFGEPEFLKYLRNRFGAIEGAEECAKRIIGIKSCSELKEGTEFVERFKELRRDYNQVKRVNGQYEAYKR